MLKIKWYGESCLMERDPKIIMKCHLLDHVEEFFRSYQQQVKGTSVLICSVANQPHVNKVPVAIGKSTSNHNLSECVGETDNYVAFLATVTAQLRNQWTLKTLIFPPEWVAGRCGLTVTFLSLSWPRLQVLLDAELPANLALLAGGPHGALVLLASWTQFRLSIPLCSGCTMGWIRGILCVLCVIRPLIILS